MQDTLYEEKIYSKWNILILGIVVLVLLVALIWQIIVGPLGTRPASNWFFAGMIIFFLLIGINFASLSIKVNMQGVSVGYGIIRHTVPWDSIAGCRPDEASAVNYGGWGIRIGWVGGKGRLAYNVLGSPRVVVERRYGKYQEFVFSTQKPEAVIEAINTGLDRQS